ncbi:MAG: L-seryl-tRNA(Sec) selenium transferase, partial [Anaeroglobus sp.]
EKCGRFIRVLEEEHLPVRWKVEEVTDMVGGGSYPEYNMPGYAVVLDIDGMTAAEAEKRLREADIPVIVRVQHDRILISVRTVQEDEFIIICRTLASACK